MGLQVWLPLNGSLNNHGLTNVSPVNNGATINANGKIGSCYQFNGSSHYIDTGYGKGISNKEISLTLWVKPLASLAEKMVIGCSNGSNQRLYIGVKNNTYNLSFGSQTWGRTTSAPVTTNKWDFLAIVVKDYKATLYFNGVEVESFTQSAFNLASNIYVGGRTDGYYSNALINDVRIYDHALSMKELKEISKALCLHYTLNNNGYGQENLVAGSETFSGWTISDGWTKVLDTDGTTYIKFSRTGATANNWVRAIPAVKLNPNDYPNGITVSFDFKVTDLSALNHKCVISLQTYNASGTRVGWNEPNNTSFSNYNKIVNGQWVRIARYFTQTDLLCVSQSGYTTADISYTMLSFQLVQNGEIFIRKVKAEAGNTMTTWSPNSADTFYNSTEFDSSGYRNNATPIDATIKHLVGSPRYSVYTKFDGSAGGLKIDNTAQISPVLNNGIFTISFWAKHDVSGNREIYFGNFDASADFNLERTAGNDLRFYWNASPDLTMSGTTISDTNWHHIVVTRNGNAIKCYIDGVSKYSGTATIASLTFDGSFRLGRDTRTGTTAFGGGMSDFRLYATALSDSDILELYNAPAAVDNDGNMYAMQLVEVI